MSQPPTQQAFSDRFWTTFYINSLVLKKWQCSFSVARERCDKSSPWEKLDRFYEDSKGVDQPTQLHKMVCSYTVGIHENISNRIWKFPSWSDQFALYTVGNSMTFYRGVAKNRSYHTSASGNRRVSVVIFIKVRWYFLYQFYDFILLKIK